MRKYLGFYVSALINLSEIGKEDMFLIRQVFFLQLRDWYFGKSIFLHFFNKSKHYQQSFFPSVFVVDRNK